MNATIPFLATMALGVMGGITGTHYKQINKMVEHGALGSSIRASEALPVHDDVPKDTVVKLPVSLAKHDNIQTGSHTVASVYENQQQGALLEILAEMRREQKSMRLQMAEMNRDLAEANFRLDATSNDFRPLQIDSDRPRSMGDPMDSKRGSGDLLLPPKP